MIFRVEYRQMLHLLSRIRKTALCIRKYDCLDRPYSGNLEQHVARLDQLRRPRLVGRGDRRLRPRADLHNPFQRLGASAKHLGEGVVGMLQRRRCWCEYTTADSRSWPAERGGHFFRPGFFPLLVANRPVFGYPRKFAWHSILTAQVGGSGQSRFRLTRCAL